MYCLIGLVTVVVFSSNSLAQQCYFPNGNEVASDTACNPDALVSACCFDGQACLSNGLCVSDPTDATLARTHRGTCTDQDWKSGNCPSRCLEIDDLGANVYSCNQTNVDSYCCFDNCECDNRWEVFSFTQPPAEVYTVTIIGDRNFIPQTRPPTSAVASTSATATVSTSSPTTTASADINIATAAPGSESTSSSGTAIGVGVGVGVGGAALIAIAVLFFYWRKKNSNRYRGFEDGMALKPVEVANTEYHAQATRYAHYGNGVRDEKPSTSGSSPVQPFQALQAELPAQNVIPPTELPASPPPIPRK